MNFAYSRLSGCTSMVRVAYMAKKPIRARPTPVHMFSWYWVMSSRVTLLVVPFVVELSASVHEETKQK